MSTQTFAPSGYLKTINFRHDPNATADLQVGECISVGSLKAYVNQDLIEPGELGAAEFPQEVQYKDYSLETAITADLAFGEPWFNSEGDEHIVVGTPSEPGALNGVAVASGGKCLRVIEVLGTACLHSNTIPFDPPMATNLNSIQFNTDTPLTGPWTLANYEDASTGILKVLNDAGYTQAIGQVQSVNMTADGLTIKGIDFGTASITAVWDQ